MSKPHLFTIQLLNAQPYYLPGSWIEGVVQLRTAESIQARAIRLKLDGNEKASWEKKQIGPAKEGEEKESYKRKVEIIDSSITLWGYPKHNGENTLKISSGSYVFPFSVQVPVVDSLPPTSQFTNGGVETQAFKAHVRYRLIANIDIPSGDIKVACPIRILPRIAVTSVAGWNVAEEQSETKQVGCCCCIGGNVRVRARCLSSAVMLGGSLLCTAEIINDSNRSVVGVELSLEQVNTFQTDTATTRNNVTVASSKYPVVLERGENFSNLSCAAAPGTVPTIDQGNGANSLLASQLFALVVPQGTAPQFKGKVITSVYELVFRVKLQGACVIDVRMNFTPTICTQETNVPVTAIFTPTILNPTGQPRSAVLLLPATKGQYPANFGFDGMNYRPNEQFDTSKQVAYPCFYNANWHAVPASVNSFNGALLQALSAT